ncbi:flavin reductase family protein [Bacillus xiapuensis]|uniref:Flavin reductase family protein n=1 Tax=Bacillus xiapuensis TaxID=2014075 RepID=A0ABU6N7H6_9BACI|nr:flavin reductase family protein [Bacillus xiapuensis]
MKKEDSQGIFKQIMGDYPTGVTIVTTTKEDGTPVGLTVNSFASVSLDPLMLLWSIDHRVSSLKEFTDRGKFAVHVLAEEQKELCQTFASKHEDRFSTCNWELSSNGLPIIEGALGVFECKTFKAIEAGDHTVFIGEVLDLKVNKEKDPMLYHRRVFGAIPKEFYNQKQSVPN